MALMLMMVINLALTLWVLKVLDFNSVRARLTLIVVLTTLKVFSYSWRTEISIHVACNLPSYYVG